MAARNYLSALLLLLAFFAGSEAGPTRIESVQDKVNVGDKITLRCYLDEAVSLSKGQAVFFYKRQRTREANATDTLSTSNFVISQVYMDRGSEVSIRPDTVPADTQYEFDIPKAKHEDSGEFGCVVTTSKDKDYHDRISWTKVAVKRQVDEIQMTAIAANGTEYPLKDGEMYRLTSKENYKLRCMTRGSIPQSKMDVFLGDQKITEQLFDRSDIPTKMQDNVGAHDVITFESTLESKQPLVVEVPKPITCKASVDNTEGLSFTFETDFPHPPVITCNKTYAGYEIRNVRLSCQATGNPPLTESYWIVTLKSGLSEVIRKGETNSEFSYEVEETWSENRTTLTTTLVIGNAIKKSHFDRSHVAVVKNEAGQKEAHAILIHDPEMGANIDSSTTRWPASLILTILALMFWTLFGR